MSEDWLVDFYGRDFIVNSDVLIPRPETEMIIDAVLNLVGKPYLSGVKPSEAVLPEDLTIVDVGTGSGCIAVTLGLELTKAKIYAVDVSELALKVAKKNLELHKVQGVEILYSDLLNDISEYLGMASDKKNDTEYLLGERVDLVVANLPYVDESWEWLDKKALEAEPRLALYAENGGLALIYKLIDQVTESGIRHLILEADPCQHERIIEYAKKKGLTLGETRGYVLYLLV